MEQPTAAKRAKTGASGTPVFVCEYHDEALRCLHFGIRRRKVPFEGLTMVHFDAHPDLSASTTLPAELILEDPHQVYYALRNDVAGIAQWILPAAYAGHLSCVWWLRPAWAQQIADGDYRVQVGRALAPVKAVRRAAQGPEAKRLPTEKVPEKTLEEPAQVGEVDMVESIKISCAEPYFVEDDIYRPPAELRAPRPLRLAVSQLDGTPPVQLGSEEPWILDVCLDFFACGNPFLTQVRAEIARPFSEVLNAASFRSGSVLDVAAFLRARDAFDAAYDQLLTEALEERPWSSALERLGALLPSARREELVSLVRHALARAAPRELELLRAAEEMAALPFSSPTEEELLERLQRFEQFLRSLPGRPRLVTVARSVVDGFCPMRFLCRLETQLLEVLRRLYGSLEVVYSDELDAKELA